MGDDDIIIAGEDDVPTVDSTRDEPTCGRCGTELEWRLTMNCQQERYCPVCDAEEDS